MSGLRRKRIAILGSGIMGSSAAIYLARRGADVTLFDRTAVPFSAASRWNEGKILLGFLYSADPSLGTADHILPGSLQFKPLVEDLLAGKIDAAVTATDDIFLCHRNSVVSEAAMENYFRQLSARVRQHPDAPNYLADASSCQTQRLTSSELTAITNSPDIVAGFRVPERSVATNWIADRFVAAIASESRIESRMGAAVVAVRPEYAGDITGRWQVLTDDGGHDTFDFVINALWEGRMAIDATAGLQPKGIWSNRYRLALFIRTAELVDVPCTIIATGPFGDIKNYNNRDFYLSWYPDGLRIDSSALEPPHPAPLDEPSREQLCKDILSNLEGILPDVARIRSCIESMTLQGGWVFAAGNGLLSDPQATLHGRSTYGVTRRGTYFSIDTGKYASAPWLARQLADSLF